MHFTLVVIFHRAYTPLQMPFQGIFSELVCEQCAELRVERKRVGLEDLSVQVHWQASQGGQAGQSLHAIYFLSGGKKSVESIT